MMLEVAMKTLVRWLLVIAACQPFMLRAQLSLFCAAEDRAAGILASHWERQLRESRLTTFSLSESECRESLAVGTAQLGLLTESSLDSLFEKMTIRGYGRNRPFSNIDAAFKRRDSSSANAIVWVGVGWITWRSLGQLQPKGGCRPTQEWAGQVCAEEWGGDQFKILHKAGHPGWPVVGLGIQARIQKPQDADIVADAAASAETSKIARDHFVVVADEGERKRRKVWFEMWSPDGQTKLAETVASDSADVRAGYPLPASTKRTTNSGFDACGNPKAACAPYKVAPDVQKRITDYLEKAKPAWR
jgi:hypothetical protein